jgi:hypothetical protein
MPCTKIGISSRSASAQNSANSSSCSERPNTFEAISTATSPMSLIRASSAVASPGACIGTIDIPRSRPGSARHSSAMNSFTRRESSSPSEPGRP